MGRAARIRHLCRCRNRRGCPMPQPNDLSRSLTALDQDSTLIAVVEMSQSSWLVGGIIPGVERHPAKKLAASETLLLSLLHRWREEVKLPRFGGHRRCSCARGSSAVSMQVE